MRCAGEPRVWGLPFLQFAGGLVRVVSAGSTEAGRKTSAAGPLANSLRRLRPGLFGHLSVVGRKCFILVRGFFKRIYERIAV